MTQSKIYELKDLKEKIMLEVEDKYNTWQQIYTDGSKSASVSGSTYYDFYANKSACFKISSLISILTVELIALLESINYSLSTGYKKHVMFYDFQINIEHIARCASGHRGVSIAYKYLKIS